MKKGRCQNCGHIENKHIKYDIHVLAVGTPVKFCRVKNCKCRGFK